MKNLFRRISTIVLVGVIAVGLMPTKTITAANKENLENNKELYNIDLVNGELKIDYNEEMTIYTKDKESFEVEFKDSILVYNFKNKYELNTSIENQKEIKNRSEDELYYVDNLETNQDLQEYSKKFLKEKYNLDLDVLVEFNEDKEEDIRGTFYYNTEKNEALYIDINTNLDCTHEVIRTLNHELTHYALFKLNKNFDDGQEEFESENFLNGGRSNENTRQSLMLDTRVRNADCCN